MSLHGVDIASYQKDMDCSKIKADFVIIKATQGNSYVNPHCSRHYQQAKDANKLTGLYHYATGIGAEVEADFFVDKVHKYLKDAILVLDWEHNEKGGANPVFGTSREVDYVHLFMERVHSRTGVYPLLYMSASVTRRRDWKKVARISELWVAQYGNNQKITDYQESPWRDNKGLGAWSEPPAIHQYTSSGSIQGYRQTDLHKLDLDIAYISKTDWLKLANGTFKRESASINEITPLLIDQVLDGVYFTGATRTIALANAGYNPVEVQNKINELYELAKQIDKYKKKAGPYWNTLLKIL